MFFQPLSTVILLIYLILLNGFCIFTQRLGLEWANTHTQYKLRSLEKKSRFSSLEFGIRGSKTASKSLHLDCDAKGDEILRKFYARGRC